MNTLRFGLLGAVSGGLAGGSVYIPVGELPGFELLGLCVGVRALSSCGGFMLSAFVFPGLVFGVVFGIALECLALLRRQGAVMFAAGATIAYVVAVATALMAMDVIGSDQPALAVIGGAVGALGGGLLAGLAVPLLRLDSWTKPALVGAALGGLLPLWQWEIGMIAFYVVWQAGYAAALAAELPRRTAA